MGIRILELKQKTQRGKIVKVREFFVNINHIKAIFKVLEIDADCCSWRKIVKSIKKSINEQKNKLIAKIYLIKEKTVFGKKRSTGLECTTYNGIRINFSENKSGIMVEIDSCKNNNMLTNNIIKKLVFMMDPLNDKILYYVGMDSPSQFNWTSEVPFTVEFLDREKITFNLTSEIINNDEIIVIPGKDGFFYLRNWYKESNAIEEVMHKINEVDFTVEEIRYCSPWGGKDWQYLNFDAKHIKMTVINKMPVIHFGHDWSEFDWQLSIVASQQVKKLLLEIAYDWVHLNNKIDPKKFKKISHVIWDDFISQKLQEILSK